jgi:uncharacterized protein (TIGR02271 family)
MDDDQDQQRTVPVIEEELVTGTREIKTGTVRIRKEVERVRKTVEMPAVRDVVKVSRVPVNRVISTMPEIRTEGDIVIVPVVEEEIVVEKRLVLKEEIRLHRRRVRGRVTKSVGIGREHATVERLDSEGNVIARSRPRPKSV